jgi:catechol 2,3-dioxygenase-like lactoylglutathione lyase family enzyme
VICFFLVVGALSIAGETCQHRLTGHACSHAFVIFKAAAARVRGVRSLGGAGAREQSGEVKMPSIANLFHVAIKTNDLDDTVRFYTEVLGLHPVARPDFGYPGPWLAAPGSAAIIHIYAGGAALGPGGRAPYGTGAIDHVSITATSFHGFIERFKKHGLEWGEFNVREAGLWQLFVHDPSGVQLEITFEAAKESGPEPDVKNRGYVAGSSFLKEPMLA